MALSIEVRSTVPFSGQKPGTSGLRKKVREFMQDNYTENFVQCIVTACPGVSAPGSCLVVGGDGRYLCGPVVETIIRICAANGVIFCS